MSGGSAFLGVGGKRVDVDFFAVGDLLGRLVALLIGQCHSCLAKALVQLVLDGALRGGLLPRSDPFDHSLQGFGAGIVLVHLSHGLPVPDPGDPIRRHRHPIGTGPAAPDELPRQRSARDRRALRYAGSRRRLTHG